MSNSYCVYVPLFCITILTSTSTPDIMICANDAKTNEWLGCFDSREVDRLSLSTSAGGAGIPATNLNDQAYIANELSTVVGLNGAADKVLTRWEINDGTFGCGAIAPFTTCLIRGDGFFYACCIILDGLVNTGSNWKGSCLYNIGFSLHVYRCLLHRSRGHCEKPAAINFMLWYTFLLIEILTNLIIILIAAPWPASRVFNIAKPPFTLILPSLDQSRVVLDPLIGIMLRE